MNHKLNQLMQNILNWPVLIVLALVAAAASALTFFIKVAEEVVEGDTHKIDLEIILWLRDAGNPADPLGPAWLEDFARDITALGSPAVLGLFVLIASFFLLLFDVGRPHRAPGPKARTQALYHERRSGSDRAGGIQQGLSRRPLAQRCTGRLGRRRSMGAGWRSLGSNHAIG